MAHSDPERPSLRQRVRDAGGWYAWFNTRLIRLAGPAAVGPYDTTPEPSREQRACPLCGSPMADHEIDRSGPRTQLYCP